MNGQLSLVVEASWSERARSYIEHLAPGDEFTAEIIRRAIGDPPESNALGAIVMQASRKHLIRYAGQDRRTGRAIARGRYLRVWVKA